MGTQDNSNCVIIHGCAPGEREAMNPEDKNYNNHWIPWIKKELEMRGIKTKIPLMPNPSAPNYNAFKKEFKKCTVSENTILIGHSCGTSFLVRWLGESKQKIKKLILVAPWKTFDENDSLRKAFYDYPIDNSIKSRIKEIVLFTADNEAEAGKISLQIFHDAFGGKTISLKRMGHYNLEDTETEKFPELLQEAIQ
jgi:hypothetical protein